MTIRAWVAVGVLLVLTASLPADAGFGQINAANGWAQGMSAFDSGDFAGAIQHWTADRVAKYNQTNPAYFQALGVAYLRLGDFNQAAAAAHRGLELNPTDPQVISRLHATLARAHHAEKRHDPAMMEMEAAIAAAPQDPTIYLVLARIHTDAGRHDKAVTAATRSLELKPSADGYALLGSAQLKLDKPGAALQSFERGVALDPKSANARQGVAMAQMALLDFPAAAVAAREAINAGVSEGAFYEVAALYYAGRFDDALARLEASIADAERAGIGIRIGTGHQNVPVVTEVFPGGPAAEAGLLPDDWISEVDGQKTVEGMINIRPLMTMAELVDRLRGAAGTTVTVKVWRPGKLRPIERELIRRPVTQSGSAIEYGLRSLVLRAKGELDRSLADAQKAASLDRTPFMTAYALGFALLASGSPDAALAAFDDPSMTPTLLPYAEAHRQIGRALCYARKGDLRKAAEVFFAATDRLDARCVPAGQDRTLFLASLRPFVQSHLDAARKLDSEGRYAEALPEYAQAIRFAADEKEAATLRAALFAAAGKMPTPPELSEEARRHAVRGEFLVKTGDLDRAVPEFAEALRLAPFVPKLYFNSALVHAQLGRFADAIRLMNIYLEAAPEAADARAAHDEIIKWELLAENRAKS